MRSLRGISQRGEEFDPERGEGFEGYIPERGEEFEGYIPER